MSPQGIANENPRHDIAGEPLPPRLGRATNGWLRRTGYARRIRFGTWMMFGGTTLMVAGFLMRALGVVPALVGFAVGNIGVLLRSGIRCRVCGLNLHTSRTAVQLPRVDRIPWMATLEECPVCGNDGSASQDSRAEWLESGAVAESPYWSRRRVALAIALVLGFLGGGMLVAEWRKRNWAKHMREVWRGPTRG